MVLIEFIDTTEDDEHWELLKQLQRINDFKFVPKFNDIMLNKFTEINEVHSTSFKDVFEN